MLNIEEKIRKRIAERGVTLKFLAGQIGVTEAGLSKMLKNNSMKVETLTKVSEVLDVPESYWFQEETTITQKASGTGNIAGDSNKQKVSVGKRLSGRQEVYGMGIDEIYVKLLTCEKEREVYKTKVAGLEGLLAAKDETIRLLSTRGN